MGTLTLHNVFLLHFRNVTNTICYDIETLEPHLILFTPVEGSRASKEETHLKIVNVSIFMTKTSSRPAIVISITQSIQKEHVVKGWLYEFAVPKYASRDVR